VTVIATRNGVPIIKDGKLATNCACCVSCEAPVEEWAEAFSIMDDADEAILFESTVTVNAVSVPQVSLSQAAGTGDFQRQYGIASLAIWVQETLQPAFPFGWFYQLAIYTWQNPPAGPLFAISSLGTLRLTAQGNPGGISTPTGSVVFLRFAAEVPNFPNGSFLDQLSIGEVAYEVQPPGATTFVNCDDVSGGNVFDYPVFAVGEYPSTLGRPALTVGVTINGTTPLVMRKGVLP
jgi:hypothetical protein